MDNDTTQLDVEQIKAKIRDGASDPAIAKMRTDLAQFTADTFDVVGEELQATGHIFGSDRVNGLSPANNGSDEVVAVGLLLRIAGQLVSASNDLFTDGRNYAAAALLRQLVEVEYLAWAFATRDRDAERWLRSTRDERRSFFTPAKLRKAADGKFRGQDYGHHCELGGHPVPRAVTLFRDDQAIVQLLLADLLGHTGRIWDHLLDWAQDNDWSAPLAKRRVEMFSRYNEW